MQQRDCRQRLDPGRLLVQCPPRGAEPAGIPLRAGRAKWRGHGHAVRGGIQAWQSLLFEASSSASNGSGRAGREQTALYVEKHFRVGGPRRASENVGGGAMRIISGAARGCRLQAPAGEQVRPTPGRIREALFSSLMEVISGAAVLDLYAGTGSLGLECLSRGADRVVLVEADRE